MLSDTLDTLARALAEPMPRRQAVRLIGTSLAAVAVSGVRLPTGRAAPARRAVKCLADQRTCQKGAEAKFAEYCCPRPSWQFFCGGQDNGYKCINQCKGPANFPCTALIADRDAGRNGVCCDITIHSGCNQATKYPDDLTCPKPFPGKKPDPKCLPGTRDPRAGTLYRTSGGGSVPQCTFCAGTMCENERLDPADPSRWVCCIEPSRCDQGVCRCKNGRYATRCLSVGTRAVFDPEIDFTIIGHKCCPEDARYCCGSTCCKTPGCCGTKCCPDSTSHRALSRGRKVCCPRERITSTGGGSFVCCPVGTVANPSTGGCCPKGSLDCCKNVHCGEKLCVRGRCP